MVFGERLVWRGHRKEAKRGQPCGHRVQRTCGAIGSVFLTCSTPWLSLIAVWFVLGATHRGQPWTPALTLPHVRDGLSVLQEGGVLYVPHALPLSPRAPPIHAQRIAQLYHYRTRNCLPPKK